MRHANRIESIRRALAVPACALVAALISAVPAEAAFPGVPGPIAYPRFTISEFDDTGGLLAHGPRRRGATVELTDNPTDNSPSYSPDGRLIVFAANRDAGPSPRGSHIYLIERDGRGITQLTSGNSYDSNPSFSPDGKLVVFDRGGLQVRATQIFSVPVAGGDPHRITDASGSDYDPTFTPDGKRIVFVSNRMTSGRRDRSNILSMRPDGSQIRLLIGGPRNEFDPDVSPDGRRIAFSSNRDHGPNLFVAKMNGKHVRELTHSRHDCFSSACYTNPSWSPDGTHIAFLSGGRYSSGIEVMRVDGRGFAKEFDSGGTEEEGFGSRVGAPSWGVRAR